MNHTITWADITRLKKVAKAAKKHSPEYSHMQHLDKIAAKEFGARNFHELQQHYLTIVDSHVETNDESCYCGYCDFNFVNTLSEDVKEHLKRHQLFEEAEIRLGFLPDKYRAREKIKSLGYDDMRTSDVVKQRRGALAVLLSYFNRSIFSAIENESLHAHPYFDEYIAHVVPSASFIPEKIRDALVVEFGEREEIFFSTETYWPVRSASQYNYPKGNKEISDRISKFILNAYSEKIL